MTIVWNRPTVDGGSEISGYFLEKRDKKSLSWFKVTKETIRDTRQKVTGLTENSEYHFRVCAVNAAGQGPFSEASDFYKAADPVGKIQHGVFLIGYNLMDNGQLGWDCTNVTEGRFYSSS